MNLAQNDFTRMQNCEMILIEFCRTLKIPVTRTSLLKEVTKHPDYPSILSISDVLTLYRVNNSTIKTSAENLFQLPGPFIIQVSGLNSSDLFFAIVYKITKIEIKWFNPETQKRETIQSSQLGTRFAGYVLLAEPTEQSGEWNYNDKRHEEKRDYLTRNLCLLATPILVVAASIYTFKTQGFKNSIFPVIYIVLALCGTLIGILLMLYEIGQNNPLFKKICTISKHTDCAAILHSQGSKIAGIQWSKLGVAYFSGILLALLVSGNISNLTIGVAAWLGILSLPYIVYSIWYQGVTAKHWCPLCLAVQVILLLQFLVALAGGFFMPISELTIEAISPYGVLLPVSFSVVFLLMYLLEKEKVYKYNFKTLQRLKYDSQIFETMLYKQKQITKPVEGLGLTLGNPYGKYHLIIVCSSYCGPCAMVHPILDELLDNNSEVKIQVIFSVTEDKFDIRNNPVKLFLALQEQNQSVRQALVNWFHNKEKNFDEFAKQYYINDCLLNMQDNKIKAMREWCNKTEIIFTPTIFINNHQLPDIYSAADLRYFLSV